MGSCLGRPFSGLTQKLLTCLDKTEGAASMQQQTAGLYWRAKASEKHPKLFVQLNPLPAPPWSPLFFSPGTRKHFSSSLSQAFAPNPSFPKLQSTSKHKVEILSYPSAWENCQKMLLLRTRPYNSLLTWKVPVFPGIEEAGTVSWVPSFGFVSLRGKATQIGNNICHSLLRYGEPALTLFVYSRLFYCFQFFRQEATYNTKYIHYTQC